MTERECTAFVRDRITELRLKMNVSEHKMSLELGKSGSYIRGITNGGSLPSLKELFNIMEYFGVTPSEFFSPLEDQDSAYVRLCERLRGVDDADLEKVSTFLEWMKQ